MVATNKQLLSCKTMSTLMKRGLTLRARDLSVRMPFHCGGDDERILVGFIVVSHLFTKNNEMLKTIKKPPLFSDPIGRFSRADWPVLCNDG